jgi:hypothetical protein
MQNGHLVKGGMVVDNHIGRVHELQVVITRKDEDI